MLGEQVLPSQHKLKRKTQVARVAKHNSPLLVGRVRTPNKMGHCGRRRVEVEQRNAESQQFAYERSVRCKNNQQPAKEGTEGKCWEYFQRRQSRKAGCKWGMG